MLSRFKFNRCRELCNRQALKLGSDRFGGIHANRAGLVQPGGIAVPATEQGALCGCGRQSDPAAVKVTFSVRTALDRTLTIARGRNCQRKHLQRLE